jgi:hypothetical protein
MFKRKRNVFSNRVDDECMFLNNKSVQACICDRDREKNIIKYFNCSDVYKWESNVYVSFIDKDIFPLVTPQDKQLTYNVKDMVSLRTYFRTNKPNMSYTLNELFSYIRGFRNFKFLHGNLHIDNIFLNPQTFNKRAHFFVIDYANSYVLKRHSSPNYKRSSFMGEFESKTQDNDFLYWDFLTMYVSLKCYFRKFPHHLLILENLISTYIDRDKLRKLLKYSET